MFLDEDMPRWTILDGIEGTKMLMLPPEDEVKPCQITDKDKYHCEKYRG